MRKILALVLALALLLPTAGSLAEEEVTMRLSWWGGDARHAATLACFDAYHELHPNITIEGEYASFDPYYTKLLTQLASNTAPDIIQIDYKWINALSEQKDKFLNLFDYADKIDYSLISDSLIDAYCVDDGFMFGVPLGASAFCLMYNDGLAKELGIEIPKEPTFDDLLRLGKEVHQKDSTKYFLCPQGGHYYVMLKSWVMQKSGNNIMNNDGTLAITLEEAEEYFTWLKEMFDNGCIPPVAETLVFGVKANADTIPGWHDGTYVMHTTSASVLSYLVDSTAFDVSVARWPVMENAVESGIFCTVSQMWGVNAKSENIEEALKFIDWYVNDPNAILIANTQRGPSVSSKAAEILAENNLTSPLVAEVMDFSLPVSSKPESFYDTDAELESLFDPYWQGIGYGTITPHDAAVSYLADLTDALAALN